MQIQESNKVLKVTEHEAPVNGKQKALYVKTIPG